MENKMLFTSESVSEGHPDKVCDQISDAILDEALKCDPNSYVACEVFITKNFVLVGGELSSNVINNIDVNGTVKRVLKKIGYDSSKLGTNYKTVRIINRINVQSSDINQGVNQRKSEDKGAGDQGMMFGYAVNDTHNYMPLSLSIAHSLMIRANQLRHEGKFKNARPDMKSQVTIDFTDPKHIRIHTIVMSVSHEPRTNLKKFKEFIKKEIMDYVVKTYHLNNDYKYYINTTGRFVICGPKGDTGLTGRKIIVDTYGGAASHGGGAFSGKDPSKVDRSGAYMARYIAKNLVAAGVASRLEVQLSYAIGMNEPISIGLRTYHTSKLSDEKILEIIKKVFDARPGKIVEQFSLRKPSFKYEDLASYGHFGREDLNLPWEKLDKVEEIRKLM